MKRDSAQDLRGTGSPPVPDESGVARLVESLLQLGALCAARARAIGLRARGARVGPKASIGPRCVFENPWCVTLGERTSIEADVYVKVTRPDAVVEIGAYAFVGRGTEIDVSRAVIVGSHALIAPRCFVTDHSHRFTDPSLRLDEQGSVEAPVRIGDDVWIGVGAVILAGVTVGERAVVGAGAVVRKPVPPGEVHAGVPARKIGERS